MCDIIKIPTNLFILPFCILKLKDITRSRFSKKKEKTDFFSIIYIIYHTWYNVLWSLASLAKLLFLYFIHNRQDICRVIGFSTLIFHWNKIISYSLIELSKITASKVGV